MCPRDLTSGFVGQGASKQGISEKACLELDPTYLYSGSVIRHCAEQTRQERLRGCPWANTSVKLLMAHAWQDHRGKGSCVAVYGNTLTISGAHKDLQGADDGAVEGPAQEGDGAGARPLQREAQPIVLVLQRVQA